jgi:hypothetical protein
MPESSTDKKSGQSLITQICQLTGLPEELIQGEFMKMISESQLNADRLSLEDIRFILAEYLQDTLLQAKNHLSEEGEQRTDGPIPQIRP